MQLTRYMPFPRFVSGLNDGLFIPCATLFDERWEGRLPFANLPENELLIVIKQFKQFAQWAYVSCWHHQTYESFPMWKINGQVQEAISIRTTYKKLQDTYVAQYRGTETYLREVEYGNPAMETELLLRKDIPSIFGSSANVKRGGLREYLRVIYLKHHTYEYEKEVRLVSIDSDYSEVGIIPNPRRGIHLNIRSTPDFIEEVTTAPGAPEWFFRTVKETVARFGIQCEVRRSQLEAPGWPTHGKASS